MEKENIKTEKINFSEFDSYYTSLKTKDDEVKGVEGDAC